MSKCITIYTDASFCARTKTGGWAAWVKYGPGDTSLFSGSFKKECTSETTAEMMAIANGIARAINQWPCFQGIIVVVTDSQMAINTIEKAKKNLSFKKTKGMKNPKHQEELWDLAKFIIGAPPIGCSLRVNKVKAHTKEDGARSFVNNIVDKESRKQMRSKRNLITQEGNMST